MMTRKKIWDHSKSHILICAINLNISTVYLTGVVSESMTFIMEDSTNEKSNK